MNVYELGIGDALVNPVNYNRGIQEYLEEEKILLKDITCPFEIVVEAGCTDGRYASDIINAGKSYIGIDNVKRYLERAKEKNATLYSSKASFILGDILDMVSLLGNAAHLKPLVVFPFNSFGILKKPEAMLRELFENGYPFAIFTFSTEPLAEEVRYGYYKNCGFTEIHLHTDREAMRFTDNGWLDTAAYSEYWFREAFIKNNSTLRIISFGKIGKAYLNF